MHEDKDACEPWRGKKRRRPPKPTAYVVVEFTEAFISKSGISYAPGQERYLGELWQELVRDAPGISLLPLYPIVLDPRFERFIAGIRTVNDRFQPPKFRTFYQIVGPAKVTSPGSSVACGARRRRSGRLTSSGSCCRPW